MSEFGWKVGTQDDLVYLEGRKTEPNGDYQVLSRGTLEPDPARGLAALLTKAADDSDRLHGRTPIHRPPASAQADEVGQLRAALATLVDPDDCQFDHHGDCQAHGFFDGPCGHAVAKELLAREENR
ncbi:hypothetical protein [Mycolicibacterium llatzerense]|uniref:Uncharacterized protein n=1 Tax=Mycolicibacterium llatzerense TaxID=280871 RepID=A0A0D1JZ14_9MYCO|nr:hypothetical protein [Mycolicibacterium llatzerense]KIU17894.1 hypothetical protein TL10_06465 [Mycolicibacterium llatzerense]